MGSARRLISVGGLALALLGCRQAAPGSAAPRRVQAAALAEPGDRPCPGGLLCEDPQTLGGFRVPLGCVRGHDGLYTKTCSVRGVRPAAVLEEFLASRYPLQRQGDSWWIEVAGVGAMRVQRNGETAEFVAMPQVATSTGG